MVQLLRKAKSSHWAGKQNLIQSPIQSQDYSNFTVLKEVGMSERPHNFYHLPFVSRRGPVLIFACKYKLQLLLEVIMMKLMPISVF